jgi:DNA-binding NarL/FixJ family response regulator
VPATVLIVDDHGPFRARARVLLEQAGYVVIGEAADGAAAIDAARRSPPELVLLDIRLPDIDGFEVARRLCAPARGPIVVLLSTADASDYGERISNSCAVGFLPKDELSPEALAGLLAARDGRNQLPGGMEGE